MSDGDEWGPWIEHVPGPCPLVAGQFVELVVVDASLRATSEIGVLEQSAVESPAWFATSPLGRWKKVIRYRIRKPRGLTILENLIADLPAPVGPKVDA